MNTGLILATAVSLLSTGCSSAQKFLALDTPQNKGSGPIDSPFGDYSPDQADASGSIVLRTKKGDRAVEVEFPAGSAHLTDFTLPMAPAFREALTVGSAGGSGHSAAYAGGSAAEAAALDPSSPSSPYKSKKPTMADREITHSFLQAQSQNEGERRDIEQELGLKPLEDAAPEAVESYLGALDQVKGLYRAGRYEAALVEIDPLIRQYPTSPKLYQMRGTLLERIGQGELALKSWKQALEFEPSNASLRKFIERKQQKRSLASP